jgi:hypothetical protein
MTDLPPPAKTPASQKVPKKLQLPQALEVSAFPAPVHQRHAVRRLPRCNAYNGICCHDEVFCRVSILRLNDHKVIWPPFPGIKVPARCSEISLITRRGTVIMRVCRQATWAAFQVAAQLLRPSDHTGCSGEMCGLLLHGG